jgi:hypothetical protein
LASGATAGDLVETVSFYVSSVLNAIPAVANAVTETYINTGAVTQSKLGAGVAGNGPAFSVGSTSAVSVANNTTTKLTFVSGNIRFDTNSNLSTANSRFTPTLAGYYQINITVNSSSNATGFVWGFIYKNGSSYTGTYTANGNFGPNVAVSAVVYLNGSTDYVEVYGGQNSGTNMNMAIGDFSGSLARSA